MAVRARAQRPVDGPVRSSPVRRAGAGVGGVLGREGLGELQRARILSAVFDVAAERGAGSMSVALVVERSGVSRRTFYEHFADLQDCLVAAFEGAFSRATERVVAAAADARSWRERVRSGLVALLVLFDEQPRLGWLLVGESAAGGVRLRARREQVRALLVGVIEQGRDERSKGAVELPSFTGEGVLGGVVAVLAARLVVAPSVVSADGDRRGGVCERESLVALTNPLMSTIVLPYLGAAAARRELSRPVPVPPVGSVQDGAPSTDPFRDIQMRLTYRTVRVLLAIAERPGASNRLIGDLAGMSDQGQVSKLLGRLQRLGLVENTDCDAGKGMPNAWCLTRRGSEVHGAITEQSTWA